MKKNNGIARILLIIIVVAIVAFFAMIINSNLGKINLLLDTLSNKTNIQEEIEKNEVLLGITDVKGQGIVINIDDGNDLIHQEDVLILIDELKNAGSQAISVNDVRIVNSTYIFCDGTVILLDGVKIGNPFTIKAIGDSEVIYGAITRNKGYIETLKNAGITITVEKQKEISILKSNKSWFEEYYKVKGNLNKLYYLNQNIGKSDITGKGLEITITEDNAKLTAVTFLQIVNDLNSAGAKAISINGNRITNMTDMMDISKKYVLINSSVISSPFKIKVIGDTDKLLEKIDAVNSYFTKIKENKNGMYIKKKIVTIDKYTEKNDQDKMLINYIK